MTQSKSRATVSTPNYNKTQVETGWDTETQLDVNRYKMEI